MRPRVELIYVNSGGGHRAAALALAASIRSLDLPWDVALTCIGDVFSSIDVVRRATGIDFQETYNILLHRGWTAAAAPLLPVAHALIRSTHASQMRALEAHWKARTPDLVVSLIPHFNRALYEALARACPGTPFVTILTDLADCPPHFWIERQRQHVICGSDIAVAQAAAAGIPPARIHRASGMIVHPRFYTSARHDRRAARAALCLHPDATAALVLFGGEGGRELVETARALNRSGRGLQLILLCGRNDSARKELLALDWRLPVHIEGFTDRVPYFMELADFFIGKPGPGSISEAALKRLPVIVRRDWRTLPQERYNCDWIREQEIGIVLEGRARLTDAVEEMMWPQVRRRFQDNLAVMDNRAVFEIPAMLESILLGRPPSPPEPFRAAARTTT